MPFDIAALIEAWRTQLLDTTKRNRLISFKTGRTGGIALVHPDPGDIWEGLVTKNAGFTFVWKRDLIEMPTSEEETTLSDVPTLFDPSEAPEKEKNQDILEKCRRSPRLRHDHLLTDLPDRQLAGRLNRLALNSRESLTEQGVATLYLAFGLLRWFESPDSQVEIRSPLLLVPVRLDRENVEAPWKLMAEDEDVLPNHSLAELLANDFRLRLPILEEDAADADDPNLRTRYFGEVQRSIRDLPRWEVLDEVALGTFSFQKLAMWNDLEKNRDIIASHDLCRAVARDPTVELRPPSDLPRADELDRRTHPAQTFHILDADSSQHEAIAAATGGASLVLDGPPGTGKSQTIANIIAEFLAAGKTVLFVSEKAAALEVVQRRLQDKKLGDFCLACHSHKAHKGQVVAELGRCLGLGPESGGDAKDELQRLEITRRQLNDYVRELHACRPPLDRSVYQAHGELARLSRLTNRSHCPIPKILERDAAYLRHIEELLARLPDCRSVIADPNRHPWSGCQLLVYSQTVRDEVRHHFRQLAACLVGLEEAITSLHNLGFCVPRPTRDQWREAVEAARNVLACPPVPAHWFKVEPKGIAEAVVQMDQLAGAYRRTLAALPEFASEALRTANADALTKLRGLLDVLRLIPRPGDSLRTLRPRFVALATPLQELQQRAVSVDQATQRIVDLLRIPLPALPIKKLRRLAELVNLIVRMGPVRPSWWHEGRRKELQQAILQHQEQARAAQNVRAELVTRLTPLAFARESANLAIHASGFRSFLKRLLPRWWSVKDQVAGWYIGDIPKTGALLEDLAKLASYHKKIAYCQQIREQYAADLLTSANGEPDWQSTLEGLRSVDHLEQMTKVPTALQSALCSEGGVDRSVLTAASKALADQLTLLHQHVEVVAREYDIREVMDEASGQVRFKAQELAEWLSVHADTVLQRAAHLEKVERLLAEGRDISSEDLSIRLGSLAELGTLRLRIAVLCGRVWPDQQPPQGVEERDWSALRRSAEGLLKLLDRWQGPPPVSVIRVLTSQEVRAQLTEAVRQSDAAREGGFDESWLFLAGVFNPTQQVSTGIVIQVTPLADLRAWLNERAEDPQRIYEWTQFCEVKREIARAEVSPLLTEVLSGQVKPEEAKEAFRARFLGLWLDAIYEQAPILRQFQTEIHQRLIERFRVLDRRAIAAAATRIRAFQLSRTDRPRITTMDAPGSSELGTLLREVNKKRRHLPLRKLFASMPNLLLRLKPCVMMSPLAVSTYLTSPDIHFDLVIFDEASQVRPHDAICAIYRGRQLIVAGDQKQLPPTSFFDRTLAGEDLSSEDEEDTGGSLEDYESILDVCCTLGLLRRRLRWHYRSRREGLIAFSNRFFYENELVTFPSIHDMAGNPAIAFEYVSDGRWKPGASGGFNAVEARRTAEFVLAHFRQFPEESLGVIAFSQKQQDRILAELEQLRKANPDLEEFFREARDEPFFVKNLENVQGDERDVILLGIGYGPDETGRVAMRFGPLNREGGERRLNVAVTRARRRMTVVASMHAADIDLSRTSAVGVKLLRAYLDYAERGIQALGGAITAAGEHGFDSPFEQEVYEELSRHGLTLHPQVGCSGFRIDLAVVDPKVPGRYLLGVECDGAAYHSSATARDRDRLRQEVLEGLGWRICRIWSTDWLRDPKGQVLRVLSDLEKAQQRGAPAPRTSVPRPEIPTPVDPPEKAVLPFVALSYKSIDDVPESVLCEVVCEGLHAFFATQEEELIQYVTRQLGFGRTGTRISARIKASLESLIQAGKVSRAADQRLQVAPGCACGRCISAKVIL
jgi:very-short-patch-repair endonuclease